MSEKTLAEKLSLIVKICSGILILATGFVTAYPASKIFSFFKYFFKGGKKMITAQKIFTKSEFNNDEKNYLSAALVAAACLLGSLVIFIFAIIKCLP